MNQFLGDTTLKTAEQIVPSIEENPVIRARISWLHGKSVVLDLVDLSEQRMALEQYIGRIYDLSADETREALAYTEAKFLQERETDGSD